MAAWGQAAFAERRTAGASDIGVTGMSGQEPMRLREAPVHLIEGCARHDGRAGNP
ncbi:hypothetical protein POF50_000915 [Streptomyces sp. SL13]|uniref:Uncharacterized protein n=1 Tax=Streptantibioticus silvisoli TaxID=2705255 RepID=A0AA90H4B2_9ACTN|nr:hypothetical protein [Streptantibioticus silvisoli]MDI5967927.1 hypothetical protein [Streptantibioticus silvisoli]